MFIFFHWRDGMETEVASDSTLCRTIFGKRVYPKWQISSYHCQGTCMFHQAAVLHFQDTLQESCLLKTVQTVGLFLLLLPNVGNCPLINEHVLNILHKFIHTLCQGLLKSFGTSRTKISLTSQSSRIQTNPNLKHISSFVISTSQEYARMSELRTK